MSELYHVGERAVQERVGEQDVAIMNAQLIGPRIPPGAVPFIGQQQYCVLGWSARERELWATFVAGRRGFASVGSEGTVLRLELEDDLGALARIAPFSELRAADPIGVLFIELATRRRLRVNGRVSRASLASIDIEVEQAYPICPKYIRRRRLEEHPPDRQAEIQSGTSLTDELMDWIRAADTFFVASAHPDGPADASHRGGPAGFVQVVDAGLLRIPDYAGNSMFNTFGNFELNPRAGLAFVDFQGSRQLQLSGVVRLDLDAGDPLGRTGGTGRWWEFRPLQWTVTPLNRACAWRFIDPSPFNP